MIHLILSGLLADRFAVFGVCFFGSLSNSVRFEIKTRMNHKMFEREKCREEISKDHSSGRGEYGLKLA